MQRVRLSLPQPVGKQSPAIHLYRPAALRNRIKKPVILSSCDTIVLSRQSQIDSFSIYYPSCTRIKRLEIRGENASPAITSIAALSSIRFIENDLHITNTSLSSLNGLQNIDTIGYYLWLGDNALLTNLNDVRPTHLGGFVLFGMPQLSNIDGLFSRLVTTSLWSCFFDRLAVSNFNAFSNISSVINFGVSNCPNITSLAGFQNLTAAPFGIGFSSNPLLTDVSQLSGITETNYLNIYHNDALTNLQGLHNLQTIQGAVRVVGNGNLTSLSVFNDNLQVLNNVDPDQKVEIIFNQNLSVCNEPFLCKYLANGGTAEIRDNDTGCENIDAVTSACGITIGCNPANVSIWRGNTSDEWNLPANWENNKVPDACTRVYILETPDFSPRLQNEVTIGGLYMDNTELQTDGFELNIKHKLQLGGASIKGFGIVEAILIDSPGVYNSSIEGRFICRDYFGKAEFLNNYFDGDVELSDSSGRQDGSAAFFNTVWGNLTMTNNSNYGQFYLSNASPNADEIYGTLTVINNSTADISVALGGGQPLKLYGDAHFTTNNTGRIDINNLTFTGTNVQRIYSSGTHPAVINRLIIQKAAGHLELENEVLVKNQLELLNPESIVKTDAGKWLTLLDNATVQYGGNRSFVWGPLRKAGDDAFTFPVGTIAGTWYHLAPISITAPANVADTFTAEYRWRNPSLDGFDTTLHTAGFGDISGREYWRLNRTGTSPVQVTLSFDSSRSGPIFDPTKAQIARWDGSRWTSLLNGGTSGTLTSGTVSSALPVIQSGPLTFSRRPVRKPIITIGAVDSLICAAQYFKVPFSLDTLMLAGNTFSVQLSDSNGSFAGFVPVLGTKAGIGADTILAHAPGVFAAGKTYRLRVTGSLPPDTSINTASIRFIRTPSKPFAIVGPDTICLGTGEAVYYPSAKDSGTSFQVQVSGNGHSISRLGDTVRIQFSGTGTFNVVFIAQNTCGTGNSLAKLVTVRPAAPGTAPALSKTGRWLQASPAPAPQVVTQYVWRRNGVLINGANEARYYARLAGTYTVAYANVCGQSLLSNEISFAANSLPQTISFGPIGNKTFGDAPFAPAATSSAGLPVQLQLASGPGNLTAGVYSITNSGTVRIVATQPGDDVYDTAAPVEQTFTINKAAQTISFPPLAALQFPHSPGFVPIGASSSSGLPLQYQLNSGLASINSGNVIINGVGNISITVRQPGDTNYLPAAPVTQSFCVTLPALDRISGAPFVCPGQTTTYSINAVPGLSYQWRLSNGTSIAGSGASVNISWNTPGTYTLLVSGQANCGAPTATDSLVVQVISPVTPDAPANLLPANASSGWTLPLQLSWSAAANALNYDVYVWDSGTARPAQPRAANMAGIAYTLPLGSVAFNKAYQWQVISRNACLQTASVVQSFRLRPLPDLAVTQVQVPATANSGETIRIQWTVKNNGPGNTVTSQSWNDAVFLSFDTMPNFVRPPQVQSANWSQGEFPLRPLLVASLPNVRALDSGQQYSNQIDFAIPINFSGPYYVYVISNFPAGPNAPLQMGVANDTLRASHPVQVQLTPTPDLRVEEVTVPATTFSGSTISVAYRVRNAGALTAANARWTDRVYISPSPLFNRNNAILLKQPKGIGSYYPNAIDAVFDTSLQLATNASIARVVNVVVPNFIQGTWFIHVETNATESIFEGALANNNINNSSLQVLLTPTPSLSFQSLNVPFSQASPSQPLSIGYQLINDGFADPAERNKGHYFVPTVCANGNGFRDSLSYGGSSWQDAVYLSTNPNGLNTANAIFLGHLRHGTQSSGQGVVDGTLPTVCNTNIAPPNQNTSNVLRPRSVHPQSFSFVMPPRLAAGTYYLYVQANFDRGVFTFPDTPVVVRSQPITVHRADLALIQLTAPANSIGDSTISIEYRVRNNGAAVFNMLRRDLLYVSTQSTLPPNAQPVASLDLMTNLAAGAESTHRINYRFAANVSGIRYLHLFTNFDSSFTESNYLNNSGSTSTTVAPPTGANLQVSDLQLGDTVFARANNRISYRISNAGSSPINASWLDSIFISCTPTFNRATAIPIRVRLQQRQLAPGAAVVDSFELVPETAFSYNNCFAPVAVNTAYVHVITNANGNVYEGNLQGDNLTSSTSRAWQNNLVDHVVTQVQAPDSATVGRLYTVQWQVRNDGRRPPQPGGSLDYFSWIDAVYFSADSLLDAGDTWAKSKDIAQPLNTGNSYSSTLTMSVPKLATGWYYVHVRTDAYKYITAEQVRNNNTNLLRNADGSARRVWVEQLPLPDLITTAGAPSASSIATSQLVVLPFTVQNQGPGATFPNNWTDQLWLSTDFVPNNGNDVLLWSKARPTGLAATQQYLDSAVGLIPAGTAPGNYLLLLNSDANQQVIETTDTNNIAVKPITVFVPAPTDLIVQQVMHSDTAWLGETFSGLRWVIRNLSANTARGTSTDGVYLSAGNRTDSGAVLQGVLRKQMNLAPLANDTSQLDLRITGVTEGAWQLLVQADLQNNLPESDKQNNTGGRGTALQVRVRPLVLSQPLSASLQQWERYYKLRIPDSLRGATIMVSLATPDSLTLKNELHAAAGYIPSAARYDARFERPNSGNQYLIIPSANDSAYYLMVRSATPNTPTQNITLLAVKLPFAILNVQSNSGGNGGNVTVKINGSLFTTGMTARLQRNSTVITASRLQFVHGGLLYATFPLQGQPLGVYTLSLQKTDGSLAELPNGFSIVPPNTGGLVTGGGANTGPTKPGTEAGCDPGADAGLNSQLVTDLVYPAKVFNGQLFTVQVNFTNPTNMDIPAPTRVLNNDLRLPMSTTAAGVAQGNPIMVLRLQEQDGPPGIIRAGGSGSVVLYVRAPPLRGIAFVNFTIQ